METTTTLASLRHLHRWFGSGGLSDFSLDIRQGEYLVLLGPSGCGKTVLLEILAGFVSPESGTILADGKEILGLPIQHRPFSLVFQDQLLFPHLSVRSNLGYGLVCRGFPTSRIREKVEEVAGLVGIDHLLDRFPGTLSGGESQRVALGRSLALEPKVLLLDEPLSSLDLPSRAAMCALLRTINRRGQTCLHVTHDMEEALSVATRLGILGEGKLLQEGPPETVLGNPAGEFVAGLAGFRNFLRGILEPSREEGLGGAFRTGSVTLQTADLSLSGPGFLMFRGEDVTIIEETSRDIPLSSACNLFHGTVRDFHTSRRGLEVAIDIGVTLWALITEASHRRLAIQSGKTVQVSVKATALRFLARSDVS
jgi:molybdopterin-binding protein